ncbi:hypothetical protein ACXR0O_17130 [Verrucomicrobiota bacterium sgz303538]
MKAKALCAVLVPVVVVGGYCLWPQSISLDVPQPASAAVPGSAASAGSADASTPQSEAADDAPALSVPADTIDLAVAVAQKVITAEFIGNGREQLRLKATNNVGAPLRITVPVAQVFENERNTMIVVRPAELVVGAGKTREVPLQAAALHSTNHVAANGNYRLSSRTVPKLELLLTYIQDHLELSPGAIQTAILALTDNLPLGAVAKFPMAGGALPSRFNTDAFRVEAFDIITALTALKEIGVREYALAMTIDPQLRIEGMIDPLSRAAAMRYYGITPEREWDFWKNELLNGEPSTRHYALYGIARFYPDVAMEMLPRWVRETRTNPIYRLSAAQALADTQKPEALQILRQLVQELGETTELGKAANAAAEYLDYRLAQLASAPQSSVAFRTTEKEAQVQ